MKVSSKLLSSNGGVVGDVTHVLHSTRWYMGIWVSVRTSQFLKPHLHEAAGVAPAVIFEAEWPMFGDCEGERACGPKFAKH